MSTSVATTLSLVAIEESGRDPRLVNSVIVALVVALRDVEKQRARGNVVTPTTNQRNIG